MLNNQSIRILTIENNDIDSFLCQKLLEEVSYETIPFKNAHYALSHLKKTDIKYQLILINLYMPVIDGFEFIKKFREFGLHEKHGITCLLTANLYHFDEKRAKELSVPILEKPLTISKLRGII